MSFHSNSKKTSYQNNIFFHFGTIKRLFQQCIKFAITRLVTTCKGNCDKIKLIFVYLNVTTTIIACLLACFSFLVRSDKRIQTNICRSTTFVFSIFASFFEAASPLTLSLSVHHMWYGCTGHLTHTSVNHI